MPSTGSGRRSDPRPGRRTRRRDVEILLATDGSRGAGIALDLLSALPLGHRDRVTAISAAADQAHLPAARAAADAAAQRLLASGIAARPLVARGAPVPSIVERLLCAPADLLVVGSRGLGVVSGTLLGSVSCALAAHAPAPLLVVRERSDVPHHVLIASDGSDEAERALEIVERLPLPRDAGSSRWLLEEGPRAADRTLREAQARGADLLVLGFGAARRAHPVLLPGLVETILGHAHCAVLIATPPLAPRVAQRQIFETVASPAG